MTKVVIVVDGGGTKTLTVCVDQSKKIVGQYTSGCTNHNSVGQESARQAFTLGIEKALEDAGLSRSDGKGVLCWWWW